MRRPDADSRSSALLHLDQPLMQPLFTSPPPSSIVLDPQSPAWSSSTPLDPQSDDKGLQFLQNTSEHQSLPLPPQPSDY
eukprot:1662002-Rhodomonas_salina.2